MSVRTQGPRNSCLLASRVAATGDSNLISVRQEMLNMPWCETRHKAGKVCPTLPKTDCGRHAAGGRAAHACSN
eukprot:scaffold153084_cov15-Prasinocladus_malaysianus.AAC.1